MPTLTALSLVERKNIILEVTRRLQLNPEEKVGVLCEAMGITEGIYYYWIREDPEMIDMYRDMITDLSRSELAAIISIRGNVLQRLIGDAIGPMTTAGERLKILQYLDERQDKLADKHRASGDSSAREFLTGPTLRSADSRFSSSQVVNIMPNPDGSVDVRITREADVIEGLVKEISDAQEAQAENERESLPRQLSEVDLNHLAEQKKLPSSLVFRKPEQSQPQV